MDSIDYYNRYAVPYYEETVDASMEEVMKPFVELLVRGVGRTAEVLDLDALTGGFNLQIAWSTAYAAGSSIFLKQEEKEWDII